MTHALVLALLAGFASPQAADTPTLHLNCVGVTTGSVPIETSSAVVQDTRGRAAYGSEVRSAVVPQETVIGFKMEDGQAEMRLPSHLLPEMHGGDAGWFKVKRLEVTEQAITGRVAVNFLHNPSFRIDRMTGELSSSGGVSAMCAPVERSERKF